MDVTSINHISAEISQKETYIKKGQTEISQKSTSVKLTASEAVVYEQSEPKDVLTDTGYKVDMDKVLAMKEENSQRMIDLFRQTVTGGTLKQIGGLRGFISSLRDSIDSGDKGPVTPSSIVGTDEYAAYQEQYGDINIEITETSVTNAKADIAQDGYWGAEATSSRFLEFAQALSGSDPSKADMLMDAIKTGYEAAEEIWGSELPQLSKDTLALTIEKFEAWRDGTDIAEKAVEVNQ